MSELYSILLSWAVVLSGYPTPTIPPKVIPVPHEFFVKNACGSNECRVYGWYAKGTSLYIDERAKPQDNIVHASIVVHEMVHYLQNVARNNAEASCTEIINMEHQAYGVQREFLLRYGVYFPIGLSMARVSCQN